MKKRLNANPIHRDFKILGLAGPDLPFNKLSRLVDRLDPPATRAMRLLRKIRTEGTAPVSKLASTRRKAYRKTTEILKKARGYGQ